MFASKSSPNSALERQSSLPTLHAKLQRPTQVSPHIAANHAVVVHLRIIAPADAKAEPAKEAKHEAPDTHGMPGMADLFKGEEKAEKK